MILDDLYRRSGEIDAELHKLSTYKRPSKAQAERAEALADELEEVRAQIAEHQARLDRIRQNHEAGNISRANFSIVSDHADLFEQERGTLSDTLRALDVAAETAVQATGRAVDINPDVRKIVERYQPVGDLIRAASSPDYMSGFGKLMCAGDSARALLAMTDAERAAFTRVAEAEARTALYTGASGSAGALVPQLLDPAVILTNAGATNPIRTIARKVTGISHTWSGVSSAGVSASWDSQGVEVSDDSPSFSAPEIEAHKAQAFVEFSVELEGDWTGMMGELAQMFADAKDRLEADAFSNGTGVEEPTGIFTALFAGSSTAGVLATTDGQFGAVDIFKVYGSLPARFRPNSSWLANIDVLNEIRQFGTNNEGLATQTVDLMAPYSFGLLGRPVYEASDAPLFTGTTAASSYLIVGDFSHYVVFDRLASMRVELVPHIMGGSGRPKGTRGAYAFWRTGADSVADNAFRMLMNA